jgi:hypothetical protein
MKLPGKSTFYDEQLHFGRSNRCIYFKISAKVHVTIFLQNVIVQYVNRLNLSMPRESLTTFEEILQNNHGTNSCFLDSCFADSCPSACGGGASVATGLSCRHLFICHSGVYGGGGGRGVRRIKSSNGCKKIARPSEEVEGSWQL